MKSIHIFKTGCHTDAHGERYCFAAGELANTAAAYNPGIHRAPLVLGHPKMDDPAYGWVTRLEANGGNLVAFVEQVADELETWVQDGRYRSVSASFYPPEHPQNPSPGVYYLRHVGFLGAHPPAVRGLEEPAFAESFAYSEVPIPNRLCYEFAAPPGYRVDPVRLEIHQRAVAFQNDNPGVSYLDAVATVDRS